MFKIFFKDDIPIETRLVEKSVEINGVKNRCLNPESGFCLGNLASASKIIITFKVLVLKQCVERIIENHSLLEYDYIYNIEKPPIRIFKDSNRVITKLENRLFKQVSIKNILKTKKHVDSIIETKSKIEIVKKKYIKSHELGTINLLIIGKIEYKVEYMSKGKIKFIKGIFGFSNCLLIPCGALYLDNIDIIIHSEDICCRIAKKDKILISNTMLIYL